MKYKSASLHNLSTASKTGLTSWSFGRHYSLQSVRTHLFLNKEIKPLNAT